MLRAIGTRRAPLGYRGKPPGHHHDPQTNGETNMKTVENRVKTAGVDNNPLNRDPLSGKPGAHPVGTGVGAAGGGAAGAAIGTAVAGPVGTVVGAVVGTLSGGLAGKAAGEAINPTATTVETVA